MITFIGKFVKNDGFPSENEYSFNTEENIEIGKIYLFTQYDDPIYVIDILPEVKNIITINGKDIPIKEVTLKYINYDEAN